MDRPSSAATTRASRRRSASSFNVTLVFIVDFPAFARCLRAAQVYVLWQRETTAARTPFSESLFSLSAILRRGISIHSRLSVERIKSETYHAAEDLQSAR